MPLTPSSPILKVALPVPLRQVFDYLAVETDIKPAPGMRVQVPFGRRQMVGVIIALADDSQIAPEKLARAISYPDGAETVISDELAGLLN